MSTLKASDELKRAVLKTNDSALDVNDCITPLDRAFGLFYCNGASSPTGSDGFIICIRYSTRFIKQIFIDDNRDFSNIYVRTMDNVEGNPQWESWYRVSDITENGETYEVHEWYSGGFTADGSTVRFTVPFNKNLSKIKSATIDSLGGLILFKYNGGSTTITKDKLSVAYIRENYITFNAVTSGFGSNTPVGVKLDNMKITFKT